MCQQEGAMCLVWRQLRVFTSWQQLRVWSSVVQSVECVKDSRHIAALRHTCRPTQPHPASAGGAVGQSTPISDLIHEIKKIIYSFTA